LVSSDQTIGIIFPILSDHLDRFFHDRKTVFVKYFGKERLPLRLRVGSRLFFYESGRSKQIVGDAKIIGIESATYEDVIARFGDYLFLTKNEFERYAQDRRDKKMLILVLREMRKYSAPLRLKNGLTMAGQYMTRKMFEELRNSRVVCSK